MRTVAQTFPVFTFAELEPDAKAKAVHKYQEWLTNDEFDSEEDNAAETLKALGFDAKFEWSGFGSQGDGGRIVGQWRADSVTATPEDSHLEPYYAPYFIWLAKARPDYVVKLEKSERYYCHENTVCFYFPDETAGQPAELEFRVHARELMQKLYSDFAAQNDYLHSDEAAQAHFEANDVEFRANGEVYRV